MTIPDRQEAPSKRELPALFAGAGVSVVACAPLPAIKISSLTDDSRHVQPGGCFVAVRGMGYDGHDFVSRAVAAGAAAVVVERDIPVAEGTVRVVVDDSRSALGKLAAAYYGLRGRGSKPLRLIGVTGTNGKTTVAWLLRSILKCAGHTTALTGTIEYDLVAEHRPAPLTTPGSLELCRNLAAARDAGAEYAVLEVSSHALDQRRCDGLALSAGVFTNLSGDHLDYHQTMEAYAAAKRRLFDLVEADGIAIVNRDDALGESLIASLGGRVVSYGIEASDVDVTVRIDRLDRRRSDFQLFGRTFETPVRLSLLGRHNVENALAAAATADAIGIPAAAIASGLELLAGVPGRLQRVEPQGWPVSVLVDYAHTDAALSSVLHALRPLTRGRLICVFGCGGDRDRTKRARMAAAVGAWADMAYVTSDNPRSEDPQRIIDDILLGFGPSRRCRVEAIVDRRRAIQHAIAVARSGDTVLIAGKGHEICQLVGGAVLPFDDVEVARECLSTASLAEGAA